MSPAARPLLIVDGDSFAHRYYHALPKSIRRADGGGGNLLDGVGGLLVRLWQEESPRAVLAAWDTLTVPTYRHTALPAYQSGRVFDKELLDQLDLAPQLVEAMGFAPAKVDGYEADDFLAAGVAFEEARGGTAIVASGDRDTFQLVSERTIVLQPQKGGGPLARIGPEEVRERYGVEPDPGTRLHRASRRSVGQDPGRARRRRRRRRPRCSPSTAASRPRWNKDASPPRRTRSGSIGTSQRWIARRRCRRSRISGPRGNERRRWRSEWGLGRLAGRLGALSSS